MLFEFQRSAVYKLILSFKQVGNVLTAREKPRWENPGFPGLGNTPLIGSSG